MGIAAGGTVSLAPEPYHGRTTKIFHNGEGIFTNIEQEFEVVRYHSLVIAKPLPKDLELTAWTVDGLVMGVKHKQKMHYGSW